MRAGLRFIVMDALWPRRGVGVARQALALALTLALARCMGCVRCVRAGLTPVSVGSALARATA